MAVVINHRVGVDSHHNANRRLAIYLHIFRADARDRVRVVEEACGGPPALIPVEASSPDWLEIGAHPHVTVL